MLPKEFKPDGLFDLVRVGKNNDGGYLISKKNLEKSEYLLSFGISDDFSFEEDFKKYKNTKIISFDPTVSDVFFLKKIIKNLLKLHFRKFIYSFKNFINFKKFYNKKNNLLIKKKIGKGGSLSYDNIDFKKIIELTDDNSSIFLKIDIEGDEYRILEDIINNEKIIEGIAIEFHDVDLHLDKIIYFIKKINLTLIHIHPNNYSSYGKDGIPSSLEMTFSKNPELKKKEVSFPHELDQKNNPDTEDLKLNFI